GSAGSEKGRFGDAGCRLPFPHPRPQNEAIGSQRPPGCLVTVGRVPGRARSVERLREYVAIPSVNPMDRDDIPASIAGERRYAEHLAAALRRLGLDAAVIGEGERASVVAEARPAGARGAPLVVASHLDTVPVDGMAIDPFDPRIEDGRLYGRGACDTKA